MKYLHVGKDLDGVHFNFSQSFYNTLVALGEEHFWKSGPTSKPYWDWYNEWEGWSDKRFVETCHKGADMGILFSGPPREGAKESWHRIAQLPNVRITVVTDRPFGSTPAVSERLTETFLHENNFVYDNLLFSSDKTIIPTDLFIEDKISNYDALDAAGTEVYLLNRPWNDSDKSDGRRRIDTLGEWADIVEQKAKEYATM